jgi:Chlamydia polymorphic membrane protein (Chlamydia_PMP).
MNRWTEQYFHREVPIVRSRQKAQHRMRFSASLLLLVILFAWLTTGAQAATIIVNSAADGFVKNACTLRDAVTSINRGANQGGCAGTHYGSDDTIAFNSTIFATATTIAVMKGAIAITKDLTINGLPDASNKPLVTLDGRDKNRIFRVKGGSALTVHDLGFRKGNGDTRRGHGDGGAIQVSVFPHTLTISGCAFEDNRAADSGGAISTYSNIVVTKSAFSRNTAKEPGGAIAAANATVSDSTFTNNKAEDSGGAIYAFNTTVSTSVFADNATVNGGGGAIYVADVGTVTESAFSNNRAVNEDGGAVWGHTVHVRGSTFSANATTDGNGGAIFANEVYTSNSMFIDNTSARGGAIYINGWALSAQRLTLVNNIAQTAGAAVYCADYFGGGCAIDNSLILSENNLNHASLCEKSGESNGFSGVSNIEWVNGADTVSCGELAPQVADSGKRGSSTFKSLDSGFEIQHSGFMSQVSEKILSDAR